MTVVVPDNRTDLTVGMVSRLVDDTPGMLAALQRMEYEQIAAYRTRKGGATRMLSGAGSAFSVRTLREVADARGDRLPGRRGEVYNSSSLTEDHELTLAIRSLGYRVSSPPGCGRCPSLPWLASRRSSACAAWAHAT